MNRDKNERPAQNDALENQGGKGRDAQGAQDSGETPIYLTGNSTLQTAAEHAHDASVDPRDDNRLDVNNDDLHDARLGRMTGRDEEERNSNEQ